MFLSMSGHGKWTGPSRDMCFAHKMAIMSEHEDVGSAAIQTMF